MARNLYWGRNILRNCMTVTLYHYAHCPFCVRVRMTLGLLEIPYHSKVLPYDDEKTPVRLIGKKMLPILQDGPKVINESLDIMAHLDKKNILAVPSFVSHPSFKEFEDLLNQIGSSVHSLAMPYWMYTPEFNENSRAYFQKKKEEKRGPFKELVHRQQEFIGELEPILKKIGFELRPFFQQETLGVKDILLASHLWGLYVVPEFQFPEKIHLYLQSVKKLCRFNYHQDFWN